jgi:hypothetical protein
MLLHNFYISSKKRAIVEAPAWDENAVFVFLMRGQSNMTGDQNNYTQISSAYHGPHNCKVYHDPNYNNTGSWQNVQAGVNHQALVTPTVRFGPILNFAYRMGLNHPGKAYIIHYSVGGTQLATTGSGAVLDWHPDSPNELWERSMLNVQHGWAKLLADGLNPVLLGNIWCQGEADMAQGTGSIYQSNLTYLFDSDKARFDSLGIPHNHMRVYISRTHNNFIDPSTTRPDMAPVRAAQEYVGNNYPLAHWQDCDSYGVATDGTHWNNAGQIAHGLDSYNYFDTVIQDNS